MAFSKSLPPISRRIVRPVATPPPLRRRAANDNKATPALVSGAPQLSPSEERLAEELVEAFMQKVLGTRD